jgi:glycerol-3-phosphate dehydrogenase
LLFPQANELGRNYLQFQKKFSTIESMLNLGLSCLGPAGRNERLSRQLDKASSEIIEAEFSEAAE